MGDSQSWAREMGGTAVCVSGGAARLAQVTRSHFQRTTAFFSFFLRQYFWIFLPQQLRVHSQSLVRPASTTRAHTRRARCELFIGSVSVLTPTLTGDGSSSHLAVFS